MKKTERKTAVRKSPIHGNGLFALVDFAVGDKIEPVEGDIVLRESRSKFAVKLTKGRTLILMDKGSFVNHGRPANAVINVTRGWVIAIAPIKAGE